jgi:hypothetical protein
MLAKSAVRASARRQLWPEWRGFLRLCALKLALCPTLHQYRRWIGRFGPAATAWGLSRPMRRANGKASARRVMVLPEIGPVDGRTRPAILYREVAGAIAGDLGGLDQLSRAQRELVKRCAGLAVLADRVEERLVKGEAVDVTEYATMVSTQSRVLRVLGLKRVPRDVTPDPLAYARARAAEAAA